jgi:hypothetical protein
VASTPLSHLREYPPPDRVEFRYRRTHLVEIVDARQLERHGEKF